MKTLPHIIKSVEFLGNSNEPNSRKKAKKLDDPQTNDVEVFSKEDIEKLTEVLKAPIKEGFSKKAEVLNNDKHEISGKSGTSSDYKSGWFVGYSGSITTAFGIWQTGANGEEENITPFGADKLGQTGAGSPLDMFIEFMSKVLG